VHAGDIAKNSRGVAFFEVHAENYMGEGGAPHTLLPAIRDSFPLSMHGVGLSIGGTRPLCREHLARLQRLVALYRPGLFSEHLAWSSHDEVFLNDLLPVSYDEKTLARVASHVDQVQKVLGVRMLLENGKPCWFCSLLRRRCGRRGLCAFRIGQIQSSAWMSYAFCIDALYQLDEFFDGAAVVHRVPL